MALLCTLAISIGGGCLGGYVSSTGFNNVYALFRDDDHWRECLVNYPLSYFKNCDESIQYGKEALSRIQHAMAELLPGEAAHAHATLVTAQVTEQIPPQ